MGNKKKAELRQAPSPIIETHCHLDYLEEETLDECLSLCEKMGIEKLITISVSKDNLDTVLKLAQKKDYIYTTQGLHPHQASEYDPDVKKKILKNIEHEKVLAIGEIGLDYHYDHSPRDTQIQVFKEHLQMSIDHNLPVVIHSREADEDMIQILNEYAPKMARKGVIHSFTSGQELAKVALSHGFYLGFNGIITFNNAQNVRDTLEMTPLDKILLETDSPYLTPIPFRGRKNFPYLIPFVSQKAAQVKGAAEVDLIKRCSENATELFKFT